MLYLVEFENSSGTYIREYSGKLLWDVVADAEADITYEPDSRITRVWTIDEAPSEAFSSQRHTVSPPSRMA